MIRSLFTTVCLSLVVVASEPLRKRLTLLSTSEPALPRRWATPGANSIRAGI